MFVTRQLYRILITDEMFCYQRRSEKSTTKLLMESWKNNCLAYFIVINTLTCFILIQAGYASPDKTFLFGYYVNFLEFWIRASQAEIDGDTHKMQQYTSLILDFQKRNKSCKWWRVKTMNWLLLYLTITLPHCSYF